MKRVLVISPHPDDEAIGCGGTIIDHITNGDIVEVIFLTSGEKGGHGIPEKETIIQRQQEAEDAAEILKISKVHFWQEPDGQFNATENCIERLLMTFKQFAPDIIYVPHEDEGHPDHRAAAQLVQRALQHDIPAAKRIVWMYEVWTPLQRIDHIVDISNQIEVKRKAILAHKSQCGVMKFDEAILCLNRYRGEMHSWPGGNYAEVFKRMENAY